MKRSVVAGVLAALALAGCESMQLDGPRAVAKLDAAKDSGAWGSVSFTEGATGVVVRADVRGLRPNGEFGFHVHEKGDCSSPDFMSAGGHFNPAGKAHAHYQQSERHAGDLQSLRANSEGNAVYVFETSLLTVKPGPNSVVGRAVVIHANPDDYKSQPAGNSGPRIACGLIRAEQ